VWLANSNSVGQVVIAGDPTAIEEARAIAKELGARKLMALPGGGAVHTPFMAPAADRLRAALDATSFLDSPVAVVAKVEDTPRQDGRGWPDRLEAQLTAPVRWRESVERMVAGGVTTFIELGPGAVLTGMAKRSAPGSTAV